MENKILKNKFIKKIGKLNFEKKFYKKNFEKKSFRKNFEKKQFVTTFWGTSWGKPLKKNLRARNVDITIKSGEKSF